MTQEAELQNMTIPQKLNWLQDRYWRFGQDEAFEDHLRDLYDVDDNGLMTDGQGLEKTNGRPDTDRPFARGVGLVWSITSFRVQR